VHNLAFCLNEEEGTSSAVVCWKRFNMEKIVTKKVEEKKKSKRMHLETNSNELIEYFKPKLQYFVRHNFVTRWQDQHFRNCIKHFLANIMVLVIDFVENYSFKIQNKVQSMHWHSYQCTILVLISWI
jgi:hypothetical protein